MPRSRKINNKSTGKTIYCRKCQKNRNEKFFYFAIDNILDTNGRMSVCISCISDLFSEAMRMNNEDYNIATYNVCKILNVLYLKDAVDSSRKRVESAASKFKIQDFFSHYIISLSAYKFPTKTFSYDSRPPDFNKSLKEEYESMDQEEKVELEDLVNEWGDGRTVEEYFWLERQLSKWKESHKCDTQAEETLMKEIVWKEFEIYSARRSGQTDDNAVKNLMAIIKTAGLDPKSTSSANSGKNMETFGIFIKNIEENEPAEYYQDKRLYYDFDGVGKRYWDNYHIRAVKNFITESRDFNIVQEEEYDDLEEISPLEYLEDSEDHIDGE